MYMYMCVHVCTCLCSNNDKECIEVKTSKEFEFLILHVINSQFEFQIIHQGNQTRMRTT